MKIIQLILLYFLCVTECYAQTTPKNYYGRIDVEITKEKKSKKVEAKINIKSPFPGGDSSWVQSIQKRIKQSLETGKRIKKGIYFASAKFILTKDGSFSDIVCDKNPGSRVCEAVVRALKLGPKWTPVQQQPGQTVNEFRQ